MSDVNAAAKLAMVGGIFEAATVLHNLGLQKELPADTLKRYLAAHPEITEFVSRCPDGQLPATACECPHQNGRPWHSKRCPLYSTASVGDA